MSYINAQPTVPELGNNVRGREPISLQRMGGNRVQESARSHPFGTTHTVCH